MELSGLEFDFAEDGGTEVTLRLRTDLTGSPLNKTGRRVRLEPTDAPGLPPGLLSFVEQAAAELTSSELSVGKVLRQVSRRLHQEARRPRFTVRTGEGVEDLKNLHEEVVQLRDSISNELGIPLPPIEVAQDPALTAQQYCLDTGSLVLMRGHRVDLGDDLDYCLRTMASSFLSEQMTAELVRGLQRKRPELVTEIYRVPLPVVHLGLRALLEWGCSIRDLESVLEGFLQNLSLTDDPLLMAQYTRLGLAWSRTLDESSNG